MANNSSSKADDDGDDSPTSEWRQVASRRVKSCVEKGGYLFISDRDPHQERHATLVERMWYVIDAYLRCYANDVRIAPPPIDNTGEVDKMTGSSKKRKKIDIQKQKENDTVVLLRRLDHASQVWRNTRHLGCAYSAPLAMEIQRLIGACAPPP